MASPWCGFSQKKTAVVWETKAAVRFLTVVLHQPASIDAILWRVDHRNSYVSTQFRILDVLILRRFNKTLSGLVLPNGGGVSRVWPPHRKFQPCRPPLRSPKGRAWKVSSRARGRGQARAREAHSAPQASITHPTRRLVCPLGFAELRLIFPPSCRARSPSPGAREHRRHCACRGLYLASALV